MNCFRFNHDLEARVRIFTNSTDISKTFPL